MNEFPHIFQAIKEMAGQRQRYDLKMRQKAHNDIKDSP